MANKNGHKDIGKYLIEIRASINRKEINNANVRGKEESNLRDESNEENKEKNKEKNSENSSEKDKEKVEPCHSTL